MPKVGIALLAPFSQIAEKTAFTFEKDGGCNIGDVVDFLEGEIGPDFRSRLLDREDRILEGVTILKDGINVKREGVLGLPRESCTLVFCIMVLGG